MVPIYLKPANPSKEVLEAEAELLRQDGMFHVGQLYFAKASDAATARRVEAERIVSETKRMEARMAAPLVCAFCHEPIRGQVAVVIAMRSVHPACAREFDAWVASKPAENDARWAAVTIDTVVIWEGERTVWGQLSQNERMECEFNKDGVLEGGYPI